MERQEYEKIIQETGLWMIGVFILLMLSHLFTFPAYYYRNNLRNNLLEKNALILQALAILLQLVKLALQTMR